MIAAIPAEEFGAALKAERLRIGLGQKEMSATLGLHINTWSQWERGLYTPSPPLLQRLLLEHLQRMKGAAKKK